MLTYLRQFGALGNGVANLLTIMTTNWPVVMSGVLSIVAVYWTYTYEWIQQPRVYVAACVFLFLLWTYIAFRTLRAFRHGVRVKPEPEYKYCLSTQGFQLIIDPTSTDKAFALGFAFINAGNWPVRFRVEEFRLMIDDRTCPDPEKKIEMILPRVGGRIIRSGGFKKEILKDKKNGTLDVTVIYGPPEGKFMRRYTFKTKLLFEFRQDEKGNISVGIGEELIKEEEEDI